MNRHSIRFGVVLAIGLMACSQASAMPMVTLHFGAPVIVGNEGRIPLLIDMSGDLDNNAGTLAGVELLELDLTGSSVAPSRLSMDTTGGELATWFDLLLPQAGFFGYSGFGVSTITDPTANLLLGTVVVDLSGLAAGTPVLIDVGNFSSAVVVDPLDPFAQQPDTIVLAIQDGLTGDQVRFTAPGTPPGQSDIPEPATAVLGLMGLVGVAARRRRNAA